MFAAPIRQIPSRTAKPRVTAEPLKDQFRRRVPVLKTKFPYQSVSLSLGRNSVFMLRIRSKRIRVNPLLKISRAQILELWLVESRSLLLCSLLPLFSQSCLHLCHIPGVHYCSFWKVCIFGSLLEKDAFEVVESGRTWMRS